MAKKSSEYSTPKMPVGSAEDLERLRPYRYEKRKPSVEQSASTAEALAQTSAERAGRPWPPANWKAAPNAKTLEEAVGEREIPVDQLIAASGARQTAGAEIAVIRKDPDASSVSSESRGRAIDTFMGLDKNAPATLKVVPPTSALRRAGNTILSALFRLMPDSWKDDK